MVARSTMLQRTVVILFSSHQDRPAERAEIALVGREAKLAQVEDVEQRPKLSADFLFADHGRTRFGIFFGIACQAQPPTAGVGCALEKLLKRFKIFGPQAMIYAAVEKYVIRSTRSIPQGIGYAKI